MWTSDLCWKTWKQTEPGGVCKCLFLGKDSSYREQREWTVMGVFMDSLPVKLFDFMNHMLWMLDYRIDCGSLLFHCFHCCNSNCKKLHHLFFWRFSASMWDQIYTLLPRSWIRPYAVQLVGWGFPNLGLLTQIQSLRLTMNVNDFCLCRTGMTHSAFLACLTTPLVV